MKPKRNIALILTLTMVVTMMPVMSFASSKIAVSKVISVSKSDTIDQSITMYIEATSDWQSNADGSLQQDITLRIKNAEFEEILQNSTNQANDAWTDTLVSGDATVLTATLAPATGTKVNGVETTAYSDFTGYSVDVSSCTDNELSLTLRVTADYEFTLADKTRINFTFVANTIKTTSTTGAVTMQVEGGDYLSVGSSTIAMVVDGRTTASVGGNVETVSDVTTDTATMKIKETTATAINGSQIIRLTAPDGVKFNSVKVTGNLFTNGVTTSAYDSYNDLLAAAAAGTADANDAFINDDKIFIYLEYDGTSTDKETLILTPNVDVSDDTKAGNLVFKVNGKWSSAGNKISDVSGLTLLKYNVEGMKISTATQIPTFISGQIRKTNDDYFWTSIKFKENVPQSYTRDTKIKITLPEGVQVANADETANADEIKYSLSETATVDTFSLDNTLDVNYSDGAPTEKDASVFSFVLNDLGSGKENPLLKNSTTESSTVTIFIPITVKADFTGDVTVNIKGKDFDEQTLTIAKMVSPLTVTTSSTDVVIGAQHQTMSQITLTENAAGFVGFEPGYIYLYLDTGSIYNSVSFEDATVSVTQGDISINNTVEYGDTGDGYSLRLKVNYESTTPSTIVISGIKANLARILPEGSYDIGISADANLVDNAVVHNQEYNDGDFGKEHLCFSEVPYMKVITAADTSQTGTVAQFNLSSAGNTQYTVNGVTYEMDAAAYIDGNNRTMVPIRYVAYALGLSEADISYDVNAATATISGLTNVVKVTTGSSVLRCSNSANVQMDTAAVNYNSRLYVPARFIAQAMGAQVSWNQDTLTVMITQ